MSQSNGRTGKRQQFAAEEKATILLRHLAENVPVPALYDEYHIQPTLSALWQRQTLEQLSAALQDGPSRRGQALAVSADRVCIAALAAGLAKKDAIISGVSEEYLALKESSSRI